MDAAGVQAQQYDSEVNDRDQVFVDCMDTHVTHANTEQRHGRPSDTEETDPSRSAPFHSHIWRFRPLRATQTDEKCGMEAFTRSRHSGMPNLALIGEKNGQNRGISSVFRTV